MNCLMKLAFVFTITVFLTISLFSQAQNGSSSMFLNKSYVDLKGKTGTTIFINETADTLKLSYTFFNWLPYTETRDILTIAPEGKSTLILLFNFPDFIRIGNHITFFNGPGDTLICHIKKYNSTFIEARYTGRYAQENYYYASYNKTLGGIDQEGRQYYALSDKLKDWNLFPAKGDSITRIKLQFLEQYKEPLPAWFKKHEYRRLLYNNYFRLANALLTKEFYSNHKINVNANYYGFEKLLNKNDDMVLNETYLYCMNDYFARQALLAKLPHFVGNIYAIDKQYHQTDIGDVNLMRALGLLYRNDKARYDSIESTLKFKDSERKLWLDSLIQIKLGNPVIGKKAPAISLTDISDKAVSFADYAGKIIVINFWAAWCGPCIAEFPYENKLYQQYKDKGLVVINICFDSDKEQWKQLSKRHNLQMVNLYTAKADYLKLVKLYNLTAPPRSILINKNGAIADNYLKRASLLSNSEINKLLTNK